MNIKRALNSSSKPFKYCYLLLVLSNYFTMLLLLYIGEKTGTYNLIILFMIVDMVNSSENQVLIKLKQHTKSGFISFNLAAM
ncbi:hypothetical protein C9J38_21045 [Photobacterium sp. GB-210]|nr:hypothetical protein C9J42_16700 [Photobacterium sp. GB-56]PSV32223.1 hypothetical protein C9J38_21045 [Photobacterium sp. GB-210]PSV50574.1 hypothetical protein C9J45_19350 [Photobacterium sp. GB-1]